MVALFLVCLRSADIHLCLIWDTTKCQLRYLSSDSSVGSPKWDIFCKTQWFLGRHSFMARPQETDFIFGKKDISPFFSLLVRTQPGFFLKVWKPSVFQTFKKNSGWVLTKSGAFLECLVSICKASIDMLLFELFLDKFTRMWAVTKLNLKKPITLYIVLAEKLFLKTHLHASLFSAFIYFCVMTIDVNLLPKLLDFQLLNRRIFYILTRYFFTTFSFQ